MFRNYLKTAMRNLWKNKTSTGINLLGLTTGLTCCLLIGLYMQHELSYDKFQEKGSRTARLIMEYTFGGDTKKGNFTSTKVAPTFKRNFPEVESAIRMSQTTRVVQYGEKSFVEKRFLYADSTFFDIFSFNMLQGDPKQALWNQKTVVLTATAAQKYFGKESPIGKTLKVGTDAAEYIVTGVMQDCPSNSQLKFDLLASFSTLGVNQEETYGDANYTTFLLLKDKTDFDALQKKITAFMNKETGNSGFKVNFLMERFDKIHLYSEYDGFEPNNSITYIYIIAAVALLILAIACFTYINLSTARSVERAREVGIRKVIGALRGQIFGQFVGESVLLSLSSLLLSIGAVALVLPWFNELTDKQLSAASLLTPFVIVFTLIILVCISLLAGSYPALVLSGFQPIRVLKGSFKNTGSGLLLRKSLIVFQFVISVFLIVGTFIIQSQLRYIQSKKLGYDREHVVVMPMDAKVYDALPALKREFSANSNVKSVTRAVNLPTNIVGGYNMDRPGMPEGTQIMVTANPVDEDFVKTMGLQIIAGSDMTHQDMLDVTLPDEAQEKKTYHYILNEQAAKELGWTPEQAIGQKMFLGHHRPGYVRAVIKDFHFASLHTAIKPLVLFTETRGRNMLAKISGNNIPATLAYMEKAWKKLVPHRPFEYSFLDEEYNKLYSAELRIGKVLNIFAGIAILLACLGLFGLSSYAAQQRMKEIGIRKVLGASMQHIVTILSKDFIKLALVATLIAFPFAWWMGNKWLQDFTYRVHVSWWVFAIAGSLAVLIALLTVSIQAIKAAVSNPVKSLRSE